MYTLVLDKHVFINVILIEREKGRDLTKPCYVAICYNYAICNTLQTALNCNAVCYKSYFKLRCEGNTICNILQIASKFYHLKILNRRKKLINGKMHRFNHIFYEFN